VNPDFYKVLEKFLLKILVKKGPSQEFLSFSTFWKKKERNNIS